jgi:hypothetical protein
MFGQSVVRVGAYAVVIFSGFICGIDVNHYKRQILQVMKQLMPDFGSDCVGLPDRQFWVNGNVHFDVQAMAQPTRPNFSNRFYLRHVLGHVPNFIDNMRLCTIKHACKDRLSTLNDDAKYRGGDEQPDDRIGKRIAQPYADAPLSAREGSPG